MDRIEKTILLLTILGICLILWLSLMTTGCQTPYTDYGFGIDGLDEIAGANECVTDGFDWICRGPTQIQYITVEKVRVETAEPVEIVIREIYLVKIEPESVIVTPVGTIETDAEGEVITPPDDANIIVLDPILDEDVVIVEQNPIMPPIENEPPQSEPVTPPVKSDPPQEEPKSPPIENEPPQSEPKSPPIENELPEEEPVTPPIESEPPEEEPITPPIENEPPQQNPPTELAYLHQTATGFWQVGFIYLDYVLLEGDQLTFLGADKERDATDKTITVQDYRFLSGDYDPHVVAEELFRTVL